jgi:hypothetical protein
MALRIVFVHRGLRSDDYHSPAEQPKVTKVEGAQEKFLKNNFFQLTVSLMT